VVLLVLLFAVGDAPLAWPGIFLWAAGAVPLALGVAGWWHGWVAARAFPFPPGSYLFATELIQATAGKCHLFSMDELVDARPVITKDHQGVARASLQLVFQTGNVNLPVVSESAATRAIAGLWAGRDALAGALASEDWGQVATHDPLYEARHGGHWEQVAPIHGAAVWNAAGVPQARPGLGLGLPVGIAVGALAALALWWGSNALRDRLAFTRARTANTVKAWQRYVDLGTTSRRGEAAVHWLPAAALEAAKKDGSLAALREVTTRHPQTAAAHEAEQMLRTRLEDSIARARTGTSPDAARALEALLRWLGQEASSVLEVRFGQRMKATPSDFAEAWTAMDTALTLRGAKVDMARIKEHFDRGTLQARENALIARLGEGLERQLGENVILMQRGEDFSGSPTGFAAPALAIEWTSALSPTAAQDLRNVAESIYLPMIFHFTATLVVPGAEPFGWEFDIDPLPALVESASVKGLYGRMFDAAFEELDQRLAASFFPNHAPPRKEVLHPAQRTTSSSVPARGLTPVRREPTLVGNGTAFFIAPSGYLVTAYHCVRDAGLIKVVQKGAPSLEATVEKSDPTNDLAVLKVRGAAVAECVPIRPSRTVRQGESVATIGFPNIRQQGREAKLSRGEISSLTGMRDEPSEFQISVPLQPGNSGGPLFDLHGNVVGVVVSSLRNAQVVNYAVKSSILLSFLEVMPELATLPLPHTGETPQFEDMLERVGKATVLLEIYEK
jgi:S1-C subfamily serine protease